MPNFAFSLDTAANWVSNNPTPLAGELCEETDTGLQKLGDGATAWNTLPYRGGVNRVVFTGTTGATGPTTAQYTPSPGVKFVEVTLIGPGGGAGGSGWSASGVATAGGGGGGAGRSREIFNAATIAAELVAQGTSYIPVTLPQPGRAGLGAASAGAAPQIGSAAGYARGGTATPSIPTSSVTFGSLLQAQGGGGGGAGSSTAATAGAGGALGTGTFGGGGGNASSATGAAGIGFPAVNGGCPGGASGGGVNSGGSASGGGTGGYSTAMLPVVALAAAGGVAGTFNAGNAATQKDAGAPGYSGGGGASRLTAGAAGSAGTSSVGAGGSSGGAASGSATAAGASGDGGVGQALIIEHF